MHSTEDLAVKVAIGRVWCRLGVRLATDLDPVLGPGRREGDLLGGKRVIDGVQVKRRVDEAVHGFGAEAALTGVPAGDAGTTLVGTGSVCHWSVVVSDAVCRRCGCHWRSANALLPLNRIVVVPGHGEIWFPGLSRA